MAVDLWSLFLSAKETRRKAQKSMVQSNLDYPNMAGPGQSIRINESSDNRGAHYYSDSWISIMSCDDNHHMAKEASYRLLL